MNERFTERASYSLSHCIEVSRKLGHTYIGSEHLLLSLLETDACEAARILNKHKISADAFAALVREYSGTGIESKVTADDMTPRCKKILEASNSNAAKFGSRVIGTEHILYSIIDENDCIALKLLRAYGANLSVIKEDIGLLLKSKAQDVGVRIPDMPTLKQYGKNFTEMAAMDKFDPVIGRDRETERLIRVLGRKNKNNPCLVGEAGVGKSAIVEGLAMRIARGDVPQALKNKVIISVDLTSMVAGAKYRGDFEERIKNIVKEATRDKSIILFIDEIHTIVGAGAAEGAIDASNILKPQLSRGEIQVIGATTFDEYRRYIEKDPALERRFQPIAVDEPDIERTFDMLKGLAERYERYHGVKISEGVIRECIELSVRYITDRFLPDKAIDVMDETCAYVAANARLEADYSVNIDEKIQQIVSNDPSKGLRDAVKQLEFGCVSEDSEASDLLAACSVASGDKTPSVTVSDVRYIVSEISGVDISGVKSSLDYTELETYLNKRVLGQESAVKAVVGAIKRADMGFSRSDRPRATLLFLGESGVGKTALASALADELFHNRNAFLRFDMSEYSEKHAVSKLIGAPPGYAGYDAGGALTEEVRKKPYSLILFDEIEKADREVQNLFLQIADYGFLTDSSGRRVNFRNTIIVMTSNASAVPGSSRAPLGFVERGGGIEYYGELSRYFSDEFINRFDEIVRFKTLDEAALARVALSRLSDISNLLSKSGVTLSFSDELHELIAANSIKQKMGARAVLRYIASNVECVISEFLFSHPGVDAISVSYEGGRFVAKSLTQGLIMKS